VTVVDDLSTGVWRPDFPAELVQLDITSGDTAAAVRDAAPDVVIHAAAQVSVTHSFDDPARDRAVNVDGTNNVIAGATAARAQRFIFLSSGGAIYGETALGRESDAPRPASPYGETKLAAEELIASSGLSYANLRLANVYGPGQRAGLEGAVVAVFAAQLRRGEPVVVHGDGRQGRDFVYVDDVVNAVLIALQSRATGTWNIGTQRATSVLDFLHVLERVVGASAKIQFAPKRAGDVAMSRLSVARAQRDLGWTPAYSLEAGLRELVAKDALSAK
jgi:UDP-glucose 4-epimerase